MAEPAASDPVELEALRARCSMLEAKIDALVREEVQREGATRLVHEILVEIGRARGVKEVAGRCLARVVTTMRVDMALIVLAAQGCDAEQGLFSFGCPRALLDLLRELPWADLVAAIGGDEQPRPLVRVLSEAQSVRLAKLSRLEALPPLMLIPLVARDGALGFLALGERERGSSPRRGWQELTPVAKQIAIAIESSRFVEAAAAAEAFATRVLQHLPSTVVVVDTSGRIMRCYDGRQHLFAGRAAPGVSLGDLLPRAEAELLVSQVASVSRSGDPLLLRALHLSMPAGARLLHMSLVALSAAEVMLILDDVTDHESIAGDLRRARALTSSLFANAPAGVLFLRHGGEIIDINATACAILRSTRPELLGKNLSLLHPELWRAVTQEAAAGRGEVTFRIGEAASVSLSFSATRLGLRDQPAGILLQVQDTGELTALREELRRKDNLALMGQMVSFIAHEIKNPLFGISSAAQVLARDADSEEATKLSGAMLSEIDRLAQLLEELLVFGSKRALEPIPVDPMAVCNEIATVHRDALAERGVTLEVEDASPRTTVLFDPARLRQVIVNLVTNAVEATPAGGVIAIRSRRRAQEYIIEVENTGEPIPATELARIFDLFYTTKPRGSGLGLAICKKIMDDHGGRIVVHSAVGERTCFEVHIPMADGGADGNT